MSCMFSVKSSACRSVACKTILHSLDFVSRFAMYCEHRSAILAMCKSYNGQQLSKSVTLQYFSSTAPSFPDKPDKQSSIYSSNSAEMQHNWQTLCLLAYLASSKKSKQKKIEINSCMRPWFSQSLSLLLKWKIKSVALP